MNKQNLINHLNILLNQINELNEAENKVKQALKECEDIKNNFPSKKEEFNKEHKETFIEEKIGKKPIEPIGVMIKIILPVYIAKKKKYKSELLQYNDMYNLAEELYYKTYSDELERLEQEDKTAKALALSKAEDFYKQCLGKLNTCQSTVNNNTLVDDSLKSDVIVSKLISYLVIGRADNLKEAINLFFDEKRKDEEEKRNQEHRSKMEEAAEEAARYQAMQYYEAVRAADEAERAANYARDVYYNGQ